jgi:Na+/H+ antiporter NhaD/arsenite permease-like protein
MNGILNSPFPVWAIAAVTTLGVITRPFRVPEAVWAVLGALTLCLSRTLPYWLAQVLGNLSLHSASHASWLSGVTVALVSNVINNLPAGLIAGSAVDAAHVPAPVVSAVLVGVDLGPNLSVTGSLAMILWLTALRREGINVSAFDFLKLGIAVMLPALIAALAALQLTARFWTGP